MALGDLFKLAKLTIEGFEDESRQGRPQGTFKAQYNPETLSMRHESVYQAHRRGQFSYSKPSRLTVDLVIDGTGVDHLGVDLLAGVPTVAEQIQKFLAVCYQIQGDIHEPWYLKLKWGDLTWGAGSLEPTFDCRLESVDIKYTAFDRGGAPLHAQLTAAFVQQLEPPKEAALVRRSSPDVTHRRVVVAGDTLPQLCREIYGSSAHYLRVAQVNGLDDFRDLAVGQELIFPPFERPGET